jgi:folate-binding Fe-S cluster repair protein YgfZ
VSGDTLTITGPDLSNYLQNTGTQTIDNLSFNDNIISTSSNADLILDPGGTGDVRINTDKISLGNQAGTTNSR